MTRKNQCAAVIPFCDNWYSGLHKGRKEDNFCEIFFPKVLKRIGLHENECVVLDDGLDAVLDIFKDTTGIRDLEQAAEHLAAHALYMIEAEHQTQVVYNAEMVQELFH